MHTDRVARLAHAAYLYYVQGEPQETIAAILGVTRSNVSRLLRTAREEQIVRFSITYPLKRNPGLEKRLENVFEVLGLQEVIVGTLTPGLGEAQLGEHLVVGEACCRWLDLNLENGQRLGLGYGETVETLVSNAYFTRQIDVEVGQIGGALEIESRFSGHDMVRSLAERLGGRHRYFNAPAATADADSARAIKKSPQVSEALVVARQSDVVVVGIGAYGEGSSELFLHHANASGIEREEAEEAGAVGEISGRFYGAQGQSLDLAIDKRIISLNLEEILAVPRVVGVATGARKAAATLAAIRGGIINVLVVDEVLAETLLSLSLATEE